jgi:hypothetical protein
MSEDPNKAMASIPSHLDTLDNEELPTSQAPRSTKDKVLTYVIVTGLILIFGVMVKYLPMGS